MSVYTQSSTQYFIQNLGTASMETHNSAQGKLITTNNIIIIETAILEGVGDLD